MCVWQDVRETLQLKIYTAGGACPLSDAVCLHEHAQGQRVSIMETCMADLLQHTHIRSDHACNMKTWCVFPGSRARAWSRHLQALLRAESSTSFFFLLFFEHWCSRVENKSLCYVKGQRLIQISMRNVLVNIPHTNALQWSTRRDGHSARIYHTGERLPLEAGPVISVGLLWCHVMWTESEEGVAGY